jgi:hypothetical protein
VFDELLERAVLDLKTPENLVVFWDVDAPATLERVEQNPGDAVSAAGEPLRYDPDLRRRRSR